jgi:shikimate kinase
LAFPSVPGNVVLIGFSGTGKSSVGRRLSARLGWPLIDTDLQIVARFGKSIAAVFATEGEAVFRAAESELVQTACAEKARIISVGGGAPVDPDSRDLIREGNLVVQLVAAPETILSRLRSSPNAEERPLLQGDDPLGRIRRLLAARQEAYGIANFVVDTEGRPIEAVADEIAWRARNRQTWQGQE